MGHHHAVPLLSLTAIGCLITTLALSTAHTHHQSAACRYLPVPWTHFAFAYGALLAALAAILVHLALSRTAQREGLPPASGWQSWLPTLFVVIAGLMVPLTAAVVALTHKDAAETATHLGQPLCEG